MDLNTPFDYCVSDISRETADVGFMYFSPEEIRRVSVEEINDISFFGEYEEQLDRGLHSPALGPLRLRGAQGPALCKTCGLDRDCPGHVGHIELACTLYNPFLLSTLGKLLSKTCLTCHKFVSSDGKTQAVAETLSRTPPGTHAKMDSVKNLGKKRTALESSLDSKESGTSKRFLVQEVSEEFGERWRVEYLEDRSLAQEMVVAGELARSCQEVNEAAGGGRNAAAETTKTKASSSRCEVASATLSFRALLGDFWRDLPLKCERCGRKPAKWRRQGFSCFFLRQAEDKEDHLALPVRVRDIMRNLWKKEASLLWWLLPGARERGAEIFFLDNILVPPNCFRPCMPPEGKDSGPSLDKQTHHLASVLAANAELRRWIRRDAVRDGEGGQAERPGDAVALQFAKPAKSLEEAVEQLQLSVNNLMDSTKSGKNSKLAVSGIRQLLEKKAGLFRMKIMGKRVNFAARSVISPDPNIESSEIGIPLMVANELTYPEVAANHNAEMLRKLVERGPKYPGAKEVHIPKPNGGKQVLNLKHLTKEKREGLAKQLITDIEKGQPPMTVFRQLRDGDPLLVNRQPTLHKPGIMAHVAKVMKKEKTIRLHYVNCNTYNADFDGDEMNLHAPQDPVGRMEALLIARADRQYLVPTSGKPLRGLIQDHCIAGAMLSKRDSFFRREEVCLLLYHGLRAAVDVGECRGDFGRGSRPWVMGDLRPHLQRLRLRLDEPCMLRPQRLWSGKQVFSMLLKNLVQLCSSNKQRRGKKEGGSVNLESGSKTPGDMWNGKLDGNKEESSVLLLGTDLLRGVLDKAQFGASSFGLTHIIHELLGPHIVGQWLASLARMLTLTLQLRGFTCAFGDLFLTDQAEETRTQLVGQSRKSAKAAVEGWLAKNKRQEFADGRATPQMVAEAASDLLPKKKRAQEYEGTVIGKMKENWSDLINMCIPVGQKVPFPRNCFSAMVQTGAKGSKVNQSQVSCCLGQQELEGRLPPLMCTFRSLPCFAPFDMASRTRGYIADRFLSGIRPQEFFFHCMAGREGLVDTAVKTSRSGYLQRCLIKHLESLKVGYDLTVRDADGTVVQFLYGEDGVDVTQSSYLFNFKGLHPNLKALEAGSEQDLQKLQRLSAIGRVNIGTATSYLAIRHALEKGQDKRAAGLLESLLQEGQDLDNASKSYLERCLRELRAGRKPVLLDPVSSVMSPGHFFGATSEKHLGELRKHTEALQHKGEMSAEDAESFSKCTCLRFMRSLAAPGEAVGVIAAQSMGEPSTQMTLNTFHLAGHGGANVTLGIPRLREIVQTASKTCSTPLMQVKVLNDEHGNSSLDARLACAQRMKAGFRRLKLMDCLQRVVVHEEVRLIGQELTWVYHCRFMFFDLEKLQAQVPHATRERLEGFMRASVIQKLKRQLTRVMRTRKAAASTVRQPAGGEEGEEAAGAGQRNEEAGAGGDGEEGEKPDKVAAAAPAKRPRKGTRGAEDKAEAEEALDAAEEADDPQEEQRSDAGDSGMYSETEDEKANEGPMESEGEGEGELEKEPGGTNVTGEVDQVEDADLAEAEEEADAPLDAELDAELEDAEVEDEKLATEKLAAPQGKEPTSTGKRSKSKAAKQTGPSAVSLMASQHLNQALTTDQLVWNSRLENNEMAVIVKHKSSQCPHSIFVGEVLHKICKHAQLQDPACRGVKRVHIKQEHGEVSLECEGINLYALQVLGDTVDRDRIYTNDVQKVLHTLGIEAARAAVVKEIRAVFGHYGIEVDHRHLSLIADYMSQTGTLRPFSRIGMATQTSSPLQQISFECSMHFINGACQGGLVDPVMSPASAIVLGQLPKIGTGMVSLMVDLNPPLPTWRRKREFTF